MAAKKSIPYQFEPVSWALFLENCTVRITVLWTASITNVSVRTQWYLTEEDGVWFPSCPCTRPWKLTDSSCLLDNGRLIYFRNVSYRQLLASCFLENPRVFAAVHMKRRVQLQNIAVFLKYDTESLCLIGGNTRRAVRWMDYPGVGGGREPVLQNCKFVWLVKL